jgi:hypothetical protein
MTYRLYIDEVGNGDLEGSATDDNIRYLSLTGVATKLWLHEDRITPALDDLKEKIFGTKKVILHRREIIYRKGIFRILGDERKRTEFDGRLLGFIETAKYIVNTVMIDKREHLDRYKTWRMDPYHYCLRCLIERYVLRLERLHQRGDVVIEVRGKNSDRRVKNSFRRIYYEGTDNIAPERIRKVLTSHDIKFANKADNIAAMQLCDLLAHPSQRSIKFGKLGVEPPNDFGTKVVGVLLEGKYARSPRSNIIEGWVRKWLP